MYPQYLPTYIHNFERDPRWKTRASSHYLFHYFPNSEAEQDIEQIVGKQEAARKKIMAFLGIKEPDRPIEYFFYPDEQTKKELMGDTWYAQAIYNEFRIHVLYTKKDKPIGEHEDTHLLSLPWGLSTGFLQEGLAEHLVGHAWDGVPHEKYCREGYQKQFFPSLREIFDHKVWSKQSENNMIYFYSLAGAFVSYMVNSYGKKLFENLYKGTNREFLSDKHNDIFKKIYGKTIDDVETKFKNYLSVRAA